VKEFSVPAVVPADPQANTTQLLVDRVAQDPHGVLFALPTPDGVDNIEHRFEMDDEGAKMFLNTLPIHVSYLNLLFAYLSTTQL